MATRAQVESVVVERTRTALIAAKFSADPGAESPPRAYLNEPIRCGLAAIGRTPADPFAVADADLAGVSGEDLDALVDVAELVALDRAYVNIDAVDIRTTDLDEKLSQYPARLAALIDRRRTELAETVGPGVAAPEAGVIDLGFAAGCDDGGEFG